MHSVGWQRIGSGEAYEDRHGEPKAVTPWEPESREAGANESGDRVDRRTWGAGMRGGKWAPGSLLPQMSGLYQTWCMFVSVAGEGSEIQELCR